MGSSRKKSSKRSSRSKKKGGNNETHSSGTGEKISPHPPPVNEIEVHTPEVLNTETVYNYNYRLSCKVCKQPNLFYVGSTEHEMHIALRGHSDELWDEIIRRDEGGGDDDDDDDMLSSTFALSSLGRHIIDEHCHHIQSQQEVFDWWKDNVAVQIQTHKYTKRPETDKSVAFVAKQRKLEFVQQQEEKEQLWEEEKKKQEQQRQQEIRKSRVLAKENVFDVIWQKRYDELKEYANEHDGNTNVPLNYTSNILLGQWVENQRSQYRRKHNIRPKLESETGDRASLTDEKEMLLKDIGFVWFSVPKQRWDERGIDVIHGYENDG